MNFLYDPKLPFNFLLLSYAIYVAVNTIRTIIEYFTFNNIKALSKIYTEVLVPILPVVVGVIFVILYKDFNPGTFSERLLLGMVAGYNSGLVYKIVKSFIKKTYDVD